MYTGTLTEGRPVVTDEVLCGGGTEGDLNKEKNLLGTRSVDNMDYRKESDVDTLLRLAATAEQVFLCFVIINLLLFLLLMFSCIYSFLAVPYGGQFVTSFVVYLIKHHHYHQGSEHPLAAAILYSAKVYVMNTLSIDVLCHLVMPFSLHVFL
jgi:hypothetical protein